LDTKGFSGTALNMIQKKYLSNGWGLPFKWINGFI